MSPLCIFCTLPRTSCGHLEIAQFLCIQTHHHLNFRRVASLRGEPCRVMVSHVCRQFVSRFTSGASSATCMRCEASIVCGSREHQRKCLAKQFVSPLKISLGRGRSQAESHHRNTNEQTHPALWSLKLTTHLKFDG